MGSCVNSASSASDQPNEPPISGTDTKGTQHKPPTVKSSTNKNAAPAETQSEPRSTFIQPASTQEFLSRLFSHYQEIEWRRNDVSCDFVSSSNFDALFFGFHYDHQLTREIVNNMYHKALVESEVRDTERGTKAWVGLDQQTFILAIQLIALLKYRSEPSIPAVKSLHELHIDITLIPSFMISHGIAIDSTRNMDIAVEFETESEDSRRRRRERRKERNRDSSDEEEETKIEPVIDFMKCPRQQNIEEKVIVQTLKEKIPLHWFPPRNLAQCNKQITHSTRPIDIRLQSSSIRFKPQLLSSTFCDNVVLQFSPSRNLYHHAKVSMITRHNPSGTSQAMEEIFVWHRNDNEQFSIDKSLFVNHRDMFTNTNDIGGGIYGDVTDRRHPFWLFRMGANYDPSTQRGESKIIIYDFADEKLQAFDEQLSTTICDYYQLIDYADLNSPPKPSWDDVKIYFYGDRIHLCIFMQKRIAVYDISTPKQHTLIKEIALDIHGHRVFGIRQHPQHPRFVYFLKYSTGDGQLVNIQMHTTLYFMRVDLESLSVAIVERYENTDNFLNVTDIINQSSWCGNAVLSPDCQTIAAVLDNYSDTVVIWNVHAFEQLWLNKFSKDARPENFVQVSGICWVNETVLKFDFPDKHLGLITFEKHEKAKQAVLECWMEMDQYLVDLIFDYLPMKVEINRIDHQVFGFENRDLNIWPVGDGKRLTIEPGRKQHFEYHHIMLDD